MTPFATPTADTLPLSIAPFRSVDGNVTSVDNLERSLRKRNFYAKGTL